MTLADRHGSDGTVDQVVDNLLEEAGIDDAVDLRPLLLELRSLGTGTPPAPSAELSQLMTAGAVDIGVHRRIRHRRLIVAAIAVAASVGVGASAAAASPEIRHTAQNAVTFLIHSLVPGTLHAPDKPAVPAPAGTRGPATPGAPSTGTQRKPSEGPSPSPHPTGLPRPTTTPPGRPSTAVTPGAPPSGNTKKNPPASTNSSH